MKITLIQTGKSHFDFIDDGVAEFTKRLKHYVKLEEVLIDLPSRLKTNDTTAMMRNEGLLILKRIDPKDFVVLLDERGKMFDSVAFATYLSKEMQQHASIVFVIGGAYGFDQDVRARANALISLSSMTFSHQLIRLIFYEQLYRAMTIIRGEPYHHA